MRYARVRRCNNNIKFTLAKTSNKIILKNKMTRVSWEQYFMNIAKEAATRSTCDRKHVGAVIVRDRKSVV